MSDPSQIHRTTAAGGVSGAIVTIATDYAQLKGWPMPASVAIAMTTVLTALCGYLFHFLPSPAAKPDLPSRSFARPLTRPPLETQRQVIEPAPPPRTGDPGAILTAQVLAYRQAAAAKAAADPPLPEVATAAPAPDQKAAS
jgi:hypothetical protein